MISPSKLDTWIKESPFLTSLLSKLRKYPNTVTFPEGLDPRIIRAATELFQSNIVQSISFLESRQEVLRTAEKENIPLEKFDDQIIWEKDNNSDLSKQTLALLKENQTKKKKPWAKKELEARANSPLFQAGYLLNENQTSAIIAGCQLPSSEIIRAAMATVGLQEGCQTISGGFVLEHPSSRSPLFFADTAVIPEPTLPQIVDIASSSYQVFQKLFSKKTAYTAFLSFSTKGSANHASAQKMEQACSLFKERHPEAIAEGEIQFDAAFIHDVGVRKCPDSTIPGKANIFIFPSLDAGNIGYKIAQRLGGYRSYGPILLGLKKSYFDLSRGATVEDIIGTAIMALGCQV